MLLHHLAEIQEDEQSWGSDGPVNIGRCYREWNDEARDERKP